MEEKFDWDDMVEFIQEHNDYNIPDDIIEEILEIGSDYLYNIGYTVLKEV